MHRPDYSVMMLSTGVGALIWRRTIQLRLRHLHCIYEYRSISTVVSVKISLLVQFMGQLFLHCQTHFVDVLRWHRDPFLQCLFAQPEHINRATVLVDLSRPFRIVSGLCHLCNSVSKGINSVISIVEPQTSITTLVFLDVQKM